MRGAWMAITGVAVVYCGLLVADTRPAERFELDLRVAVGSRANAQQAQVLRILGQRARAASRWGTPLYAQFSIPESEATFLFILQGTTIPNAMLTILAAQEELMWGAEAEDSARTFTALAPADGISRRLEALPGPPASDVTSSVIEQTRQGSRLVFTLADRSRALLDVLARAAGDRAIAIVVGGFDLGRVSGAELSTAHRIVLPLDGLGVEVQAALAGLLRDPGGPLPAKVRLEEVARSALRAEKVRSDLVGRLDAAQVDPARALHDGSPLVRASVAQALWRLPAGRREALRLALDRDPDPQVRLALRRASAAHAGTSQDADAAPAATIDRAAAAGEQAATARLGR